MSPRKTLIVFSAAVLCACLPSPVASSGIVEQGSRACVDGPSIGNLHREARPVHIQATVAAPGVAVAATARTLWVADNPAGVYRVDPCADRIGPLLGFGRGGVQTLAASPDAVWVLVGYGHSPYPECVVFRLDPSSGKILATISLSVWESFYALQTHKLVGRIRIGPAERIAATTDAVWVTSGPTNSRSSQWVYRIDPATARVASTVSVRAGGTLAGSITANRDGAWVLTPAPHQGAILSHIDSRTKQIQVVPTSGLLLVSYVLAYTSGSVWVADARLPRVIELDARNGRMRGATPSLVGDPISLTPGGGFIWIVTTAGRLYRLDQATHRLVGVPVILHSRPFDMAVSHSSLWVVGRAGLLRIGPV